MYLPIYRTLSSNSELTNTVNDRIYEDIAPDKAKTPFIVWQIISGQAMNDLDSPANFDSLQFQVMVYSSNNKEAQDIRNLSRKAIEHKAWILNPAISNYDPARKLYAKGYDANYILER